MRKRLLWMGLVLVLTLTIGCAVRQSHAPQLTPTTTWNLNAAVQLQQLDRDYRTFFKDVGDAGRQGILSAADVIKLNDVGYKLKPAIEKANLAFKTYQSFPSDANQQAVITLLTAAQNILLQLAQQKATILNGGAH